MVNVAACEDCETVTGPFSALFFTSINCISGYNGEWLHFIEYLLFARRQLVDTTTKLMMFFTVFVLLAAVLPVTVCGGDIDPAKFNELVLQDTRVWAVEFYSPMCGSCTEFAPTWQTLESKFKSIESGKINIDTKEGLAVAQSLGVLDEGLPNIRLFDSQKSSSIMAGDPKSAKEIMATLKKKIKGLNRRDDGYYLKSV